MKKTALFLLLFGATVTVATAQTVAQQCKAAADAYNSTSMYGSPEEPPGSHPWYAEQVADAMRGLASRGHFFGIFRAGDITRATADSLRDLPYAFNWQGTYGEGGVLQFHLFSFPHNHFPASWERSTGGLMYDREKGQLTLHLNKKPAAIGRH